MKNSTQYTIVITIAAIILSGCSGQRKNCVDKGKDCVDISGKRLSDTISRNISGAVFGYPRFIYGGSLRGNRIVGSLITPKSSGIGRSTTHGGIGGGGSFGG